MVETTPLSLRFSVSGEPVEASARYADARPYADIFETTLLGLDLEITSTYTAQAGFERVPATHMVSDPELANGVEHAEVAVADPGDPVSGVTSQLLYDHLAVVQSEALERRGVRLSIEVKDEDFLTLQLVVARVLES